MCKFAILSREGIACLFTVNLCQDLMKSEHKGLHQQNSPPSCSVSIMKLSGSSAFSPQVAQGTWGCSCSNLAHYTFCQVKTLFQSECNCCRVRCYTQGKNNFSSSVFLFRWKTLATKNKSNVRQAEYNVVSWLLIQGFTCTPDVSHINSVFHRSWITAFFISYASLHFSF